MRVMVNGPIRVFRTLQGLTQRDLATRLGRSQGWLSLIERGHLRPSDEDLQRLAIELHVETVFLLPEGRQRVAP